MSTTPGNREMSLVLLGALGIFLIGIAAIAPIPFNPFSLVIALPALIAGETYFGLGAAVASFIISLAFVQCARRVQRLQRPVPRSSRIAFAIVLVLSIAYAVVGWQTTAQYQGLARANMLVVQAILPPLALLIVARVMRDNVTFLRSIVLHWIGFAWLAWSAFPWYGEML